MDIQEPIEKLYARHKGLIGSLIKSIVVNNRSVVSIADLQQVGAMALIVALKTYDPSLGSLSSYVRKCIRNALLEEANSFSGVFTVDEKIRRQANKAYQMRRAGKPDQEIMNYLGIRTHSTYLSLLNLIENQSVEITEIEHLASDTLDEETLHKILDELGLSSIERQVVDLFMRHLSIDEIERTTGLDRTQITNIKVVITDKITNWGRV
jgi:RNA polymerase sigma factor (sigma-70 family)